MSYTELNDIELTEILQSSKTIAVVGLSSNPGRPSYGVAKYLQSHGYKIYPVNPNESEILGEKSYPDLLSLPVVPDIVDVFRKSELLIPVVDESIQKGCSFIFFQLGVVNNDAIKKALENNIKVIADRCLLVEHRRLMGR